LRFQLVVSAGFEFREKLRGSVSEGEAVGVRLFPEFYDLLEIFLPLAVLVERFKRQALSPCANRSEYRGRAAEASRKGVRQDKAGERGELLRGEIECRQHLRPRPRQVELTSASPV